MDWPIWRSRTGKTSGRASVRLQLALTLAIAVAPAGILAFADAIRAYHAARSSAERSHMGDVILAAQAERDAFVGIRRAMDALAVTPAVRALESDACNATLETWVRSSPSFALGVVIDVEGRITCASRDDVIGQDVQHREKLRSFRADPRFTVDAVPSGPITGEPVILSYGPIWRGGELAGILILSVRSAAFGLDGAGIWEGEAPDRIVLVDADGNVIFGTGGVDGTAITDPWLPIAGVLRPHLRDQPTIFRHAEPRNDAYILTAAPLVSQRLWLVAASPADRVYAGVLGRAAAPIAAPLLMWCLAIGVAYYAIDRLVVRHVIYLARITRAYGRGRFDLRPRMPATAPREIAMLGDDLALMAAQLDTRETALREAAEAKRVLLLEVYHRVKNNLQMIASLLSLQRRRARSEAEEAAITSIETRIHSLSLVHHRLYMAGDLHRVELDSLCRDIIAHLAALNQAARVSSELAPIIETAERATPIALLLNEALTNALKYARHGDRDPRIDVTLRTLPHHGFALTISNDADESMVAREESIGVRLMDGFARQLRATLSTGYTDGRFVVHLAVPPQDQKSARPMPAAMTA